MPPPTAAVAVALLAASSVGAAAQETPRVLRAGSLPAAIAIDGRLTEPAWESADAVNDLRQTDPVEGAPPSAHARVQVLADRHALRYRLEAGTAQKRRLSTQVTWWFGDFYNGRLDLVKNREAVRSRKGRHQAPDREALGMADGSDHVTVDIEQLPCR